jgi:hypothetical protein
MHEGVLKPPPRLTWPRSLPNRILGRTAPRTLTPSASVLLTRLSNGSSPDGRPEKPGRLRRLSTRNVRELTESRARAQREHLFRVDPATAVAVVARPGNEASSKPQDVEEHVGEANGKANANAGSVSVAVEVREPRLAPTDSRQPLLPSRDVPPQLGVSRGALGFPTPIIVLTSSFLVIRERPKWTGGFLASTGQSLLAGTNLLHKPPGAARLAGTTGELLPSQLWTTADANVRLPLLTADRPTTTRSFWALSLGPSSSSRNVCYGSRKSTEATVVLKQTVCTLAQVE